MLAKDWVVCLVEPNKFEAQIMVDVLRAAGVDKVKTCPDSTAASDMLELYGANIIIASTEMGPLDGVAWTKQFRRSAHMRNRKAAIFMTSRAFSRTLAEDFRHAGANALIGKPISAKILIATINKVLANPRPFIDAAGYVGPCRRAGIVTAGAPKKRRKADASASAGEGPTLVNVIVDLALAVDAMLDGKGQVAACEAALKRVLAHAVNARDDAMMNACKAFGVQLALQNTPPEVMREALAACIAGLKDLATLDLALTAQREAVAAGVVQVVAKAATRRAA